MSIIVVEIDTRNGPDRTVFECAKASDQSEEVKQFWKTLILPPPIESSLYSKEILQRNKLNPLREIVATVNKKPTIQIDSKTESFIENVKILNQVDEINRIQNKIAKIEDIKLLKRRQRRRFYNIGTSTARLMTQSENEMRNNDINQNYEAEMLENEDDFDNLNTEMNDKELIMNIDNNQIDSDEN